ncbi:MAG: hypothetical protein ACXVH7_04305, partial [Thermoanaerobaculia bacterium]
MSSAHAPRFPYRSELEMPVIGLESEFKVFVDDVEAVPEELWRTPAAFIDKPLLKRTTKSSQLPTGGAVYFDGGVIELVTPVIELAPHCTARVVRSLWEQIGFVRDHLDRWEKKNGRRVRLQAFSCHFNISFELHRAERTRNRTIQKLALLLAHLLPVPIIVAGANRRSSGLGVRPRRERIEITFDFTPDPGLMAATTALTVGIVREVIGWPSYLVKDLENAGVPLLAGVEPGKHETRKGWLTRTKQFPRNPFQSDINAVEWNTRDGRAMSLRGIALDIANHFQDSIRQYSDPFSYRLLFSVLRGETPAMLDLDERPAAYDDIGRLIRWGTVLPELENFERLMRDDNAGSKPLRRESDLEERLSPPWSGDRRDRRTRARKNRDRRSMLSPAPPNHLTRSAYEKVFLNLGSGKRLQIGGE